MTTPLRTIAAAFLLAAPVLAQDEGEPELPPLEEIVSPRDDAAQELLELFHAVEKNLRRIDAILNDASSGDMPLGVPEDSGLDDLLRATQADGRQVVQDIDRILEVAARQAQQGGSSGGSQAGEGEEGESPLDQPRGDRPQQGESTPEAPEGEEEARDRQGRGERPDDGRDTDDPGATRPGRDFDREQGDPSRPPGDQEPWGMLPAKVQEIFRNEGSEDVPVQYRDWIDAYYRRLAKRSGS